MNIKKLVAQAAVAALGVVPAISAQAADWREDYRIIRFGLLSSENAADAVLRYEPLRAYLEKTLGVTVELFTAANYDGSIQALAANQIEFSTLGSSGYAAAWTATNGGVEPLVVSIDDKGKTGYNSIVVTRCDSPYKTVADLEGKVMAFADPDSTSGYNVPYFNLKEQGFDPETFFKAIPFSGSHEAGVMGVAGGQFDAAATYRNADTDSVPLRMEEKGMIESGIICEIWESPEITNSPITARSNLPPELIDAMRQAFLDMAENDPESLKAFNPEAVDYVETNHDTYQWIVEMREWFRRDRRG